MLSCDHYETCGEKKRASFFFLFFFPRHSVSIVWWRHYDDTAAKPAAKDKYAIVLSSRHGQVPRDLGLIVVKIFFYSLYILEDFRMCACVLFRREGLGE